jgi:hypothetical protein
MSILAKVAVSGAVAWGSIAACGPAAAQTVLSGNLTTDNAFFAYISTSANTLGTLVASGNNWPASVSLTPTTLSPGTTYYLNIEAINYGAQAGVLADLKLSNSQFSFANGAQELLTNGTNWSASYNSSNFTVAPQTWVTPGGTVFTEGANGVGPWGTIAGINSAAQWIWASDRSSAPNGTTQSGVCGDCTVDFSTTITSAVPEPSAFALMLTGLGLLDSARWRRARYR